jgi:energy-coupling factor transporter ATP-binding protein EcfA2
LNGTIFGMTKLEIRAKFDEIVAFSGLAEFIDTPVKRYSSGMFARLGFAVAVHVNPDLLIVDEVLSVGDYVFQRKCLEKMYAVIAGGATVVFVSHNLRAVADLCRESLLLEKGRVAAIGPTPGVVQRYLDSGREAGAATADADVVISRVRVRDAAGETVQFASGAPAWVDVEVTARRPCQKLAVVLMLHDESYYEVFNTSTERLGHGTFALEPGETFRCAFALRLHLAHGTFHFGVAAYRYDTQKEYARSFPAATVFISSALDVRGAVNLYPEVTTAGTVSQPVPAMGKTAP